MEGNYKVEISELQERERILYLNQQVVQVDRRPSSGSRNYFRNHAKLYMRMPFESYLPAIIFSNDTLLVLIASTAIFKRIRSLRMRTAASLDGERIHIPSLCQPRSRNFSPVEFDGHVVDPDGRSREIGRMLDKRSENARTPYSAGELRPLILCSGKTDGTCSSFHCILCKGKRDVPEDRFIPDTPTSPANLSTRPHTATLTLTSTF